MSDNSTPIRPGFRLGRYKYVLLLLLPLLIFLAVAVYWSMQEWNAANANRNQFKQWAAAGIPYDDATLQRSYNDRTHPEGTSDWLKVSQLSTWGREVEFYRKLPYLGHEATALPKLVSSDDPIDWPDEPLVADYLEEMEPVIDLIERASSYPTPVRFPIEFEGLSTLLPHVEEARNIQRLLMLDCYYACFNQDNVRAMRDLSLMQATANAYDGRETVVSELVNIALRRIWMKEIRRTLTDSQWSAAELESLRDSLAFKEEISARWHDFMQCERAFGLSSANMSPEKLAQLTRQEGILPERRLKIFTGPSEVKTLIEVYQRIDDLIVGSDVNNWRKRVTAYEYWVQTEPSNSLAGILAPAVGTVLEAEIRIEEVRRWTLTAVALRQFKQRNEQWPKKLLELESVGLNYEDYSDLEKTVFGYEIDGDRVFLWKRPYLGWAGSENTFGISKTRPLPTAEDDDISDFVLELN